MGAPTARAGQMDQFVKKAFYIQMAHEKQDEQDNLDNFGNCDIIHNFDNFLPF